MGTKELKRMAALMGAGFVILVCGLSYYFLEAWRFSPDVSVLGTGNFLLWYSSIPIAMIGFFLIMYGGLPLIEGNRT